MAHYDTLADLCADLGTTPDRLSRDTYKATATGISVEAIENDTALRLTTIVEGTDAEWSETITFPFNTNAWEATLARGEEWAEGIVNDAADELVLEEYTLSDAYTAALRVAVDYYLSEATGDAPNDELEHILLMLDTATEITITYQGPEGN